MLARIAVLAGLWGLLAFLASPIAATSTVTTVQGGSHTGRIEQPEIPMVESSSGRLALLRPSVKRLERSPAGEIVATLKDGTVVTGQIVSDLVVNSGTIKRSFAHDDVQQVDFDQYVMLDSPTNAVVEDCPIRAEIGLGKGLTTSGFHTARSRLARCGDTYVAGFDIKRLGKKKARYAARGPTGKGGVGTSFTPTVMVEAGEDQHAHLLITLRQGGRDIGTATKGFDGDEDEANTPDGLRIWLPAGTSDPDGPEPSLRFQLVTVDDESLRERGTVFWWYTWRFRL